MENNIIEAKNINFFYNDIQILKNINLDIAEGDIIGLVGKNGSGKTTLMKILSDNLPLDSTSILEFSGTTLFIPTQLYIYQYLTVEEFIQYLIGILNIKMKDIFPYIETLELDIHFDKLVRSLSFGNQNKLSLLCGIIKSPDILLLDEPLTGFDPWSIKNSEKLLKKLIEDKKIKSIIISSHRIDIIKEVCNRFVILDDKSIVLNKKIDNSYDINEDWIELYSKGD